MAFWRKPPPIRARIWDDVSAYKKIFVAQGFYELAARRELRFELVPYGYFRELGAPEIAGPPYDSHKNLVVGELEEGDRTSVFVYDTNDLYYKIPNPLLRWADRYFKSNFQTGYVRSGELLDGPFWSDLPIRSECLPEPLDREHAHKILPCSFSMELYPSFRRNYRYLRRWTGAWLQTPARQRRADVFFLGRWWGDTRPQTQALFAAIGHQSVKLLGGVVAADDPIPDPLKAFEHRSVDLAEWTRMACSARLPLMTRGLDGCLSFKSLNYMMLGSPFGGLSLQTNFWQPIEAGRNYVELAEGFSNLAESLAALDECALREMGRVNLHHWENYMSPLATARYLVRTCLGDGEAGDQSARLAT